MAEISAQERNADNPTIKREYADAPLPTRMTLHARQNVVIQFAKFIGISLSVLGMVVRGHDAK
ncbi:MAG: hypothetical protein Q4E03_01490 [Trueperella sp.]|nr:hypothetical protein [Trueperella sp.]